MPTFQHVLVQKPPFYTLVINRSDFTIKISLFYSLFYINYLLIYPDSLLTSAGIVPPPLNVNIELYNAMRAPRGHQLRHKLQQTNKQMMGKW